jgi:RHS repeat-associated protein
MDNQLTVTDITGTTTRTYDELGRVTSKTVPVIGTTKYNYDITSGFGIVAGCKAEITLDPKGNNTVKIFDRVGRIKEVKASLDAPSVVYSYNDNGSVENVTYPGGAKEEYIYNDDNTLYMLTNKNADGTIIDSYKYEYYGNHRMKNKQDAKGLTSYTYDEVGRLKTVTEPGNKVTTYTYDGAGNRLSEIVAIDGETDTTPVELTSKIYQYDDKNQLIKATIDGNEITYIYNGEGLRVASIENGTITRYLYEYGNVVLETDGDGNEIARNIYGTNLLSREIIDQSGKETVYYMYNGHADVTALLDTTGQIIAAYYYDAFGNIIESSGSTNNPIRYAGYIYDEKTGLYYLKARMYDPRIGRFLQEDTYTGDPNDPLSLNLYTYCGNDPVMYYDPSGHVPHWMQNLYYKATNEVEYAWNETKSAATTVKNGAVSLWNNPEDTITTFNQKVAKPIVKNTLETLGFDKNSIPYTAIRRAGIFT